MRKETLYPAAVFALALFAFSQWRQVRLLRGSTAALQSQVDRLTASAAQRAARAVQGDRAKALSGSGAATKTAEPVLLDPALAGGAEMSKEAVLRARQRMDARMLALASALSLTADAEAAVRTALEKAESDREELHHQRPLAQQSAETPEKRREELLKFAAVGAVEENAVNAALSEEQRGLYLQHKEQERRTQAEGYANSRLRQLQRTLSLTEDQKEQAFQFYAGQSMDLDPVRLAVEGKDPAKVAEQQEQETLRHLEQILTPEQYGLFVRQAEERAASRRR